MKYNVLKCIVNLRDNSEESYGIMVLNDDSREYICNISNNPDDVATLVNELNKYHIEPCHVNSVIEDFKYKMSTCKHNKNILSNFWQNVII